MKFIALDSRHKDRVLPAKILLSFGALIEEIEHSAKDLHHPKHAFNCSLLKRIDQFPELRTGIEDFDQFEKYEDLPRILIKPLFPDILQSNEIKAMILPFNFLAFHPTKRFAKILANAGSDYDFKFYGYESERAYTYVCSYIMKFFYNQPILGFDRPIYLDIPNQKTGKIHHYRIMFNVDNLEIIKTDQAPELTQSDFQELLTDNDNLDLWYEKFPPQSYIIRGFTIINFFDVTQAVLVSKAQSLFLRKDEQVFLDFQNSLKNLFGIMDLMAGVSTYNTYKKTSQNSFIYKGAKSLFLNDNEEEDYQNLFCDEIYNTVIKQAKIYTIIDVAFYAKQKQQNTFYKRLKKKGIQCISLIPIRINDEYLQILEIASKRKYELSVLNEGKLEDIIPFIKIAFDRNFEEAKNHIEGTIQEVYTSIHPSVKWRFVEAASKLNALKLKSQEHTVSEEIVFEEVYPLYGQSDIKGSSNARNEAIREDLETQLRLALETFQNILKIQNIPICRELSFQIKGHIKSVKKGLRAGDEIKLNDFLKKEIYPVFYELLSVNPEFKKAVTPYMLQIDPKQKVVYSQRKSYESSVTLLNEKFSSLLDNRQEEAQQMFPHYFERYNTDGIEFNMYIGDSLVNDRNFKDVHLRNLRLWQLETMCHLEQLAYELKNEMTYPLRVASLILIYSKPLAIRFRMDEKQFDVDGTYNVRYAIVKKRIDKSYIKGTNERLTQPGTIAIVYSHEEIVQEYLGYIKYLQSENRIGKVEMLEIDDLQDLSGLKAIRVEVIYQEPIKGQKEMVKLNSSDDKKE